MRREAPSKEKIREIADRAQLVSIGERIQKGEKLHADDDAFLAKVAAERAAAFGMTETVLPKIIDLALVQRSTSDKAVFDPDRLIWNLEREQKIRQRLFPAIDTFDEKLAGKPRTAANYSDSWALQREIIDFNHDFYGESREEHDISEKEVREMHHDATKIADYLRRTADAYGVNVLHEKNM